MHPQLRPLDTGEILDGAFGLFRRHFGAFLLAGVLPALPVLAYWAWAAGRAWGGVEDTDALLGMGMMLAWIPGPLARAAVIRMADDAQMGRPVRAGAALTQALRRSPGVLWAAFFTGLLLMVALYAGIVLAGVLAGTGTAGLMWTVVAATVAGVAALCAGWSAMLPARVLEGRSALQALGRSWSLGAVAPGKVGAVWALGWVFTGMAWLLAMLVASSAPSEEVSGILWMGMVQATAVVTGPLSAAARTLLFNDLRVRAEALDVRVLTERLALA